MQRSEPYVTGAAAPPQAVPSGADDAATQRHDPWPLGLLVVALLTALGVAIRLATADQSLFGDELSTYGIVAHHSLGGVVSTVHTDAEITPPLYFIAGWLATRIDLTPELLRLPSLLAGTATIPLVYLIGVRTVGRRAALVGTALCAFSPFMIFYSTEARGYALMVALVLLSTLAMLIAVQRGRSGWWWVLYGVCTCAAVYTHYTSVFALAGQLGWLLWIHPRARRPALLANAGAVVGFLPWLSGLQSDLNSQTTKLLSALQPFTGHYVRVSLEHWSIGHPVSSQITRLRNVPGVIALVALALALALALGGRVARRSRAERPERLRRSARRRLASLDRGVVLLGVLALSVPVGEALSSAAGSNLFGTRNLASAWPAFALCFAALLVASGPRLGIAAAALAVAAFAIGGTKMLHTRLQRPDAQGIAAFIDRRAAPRDVVIDGTILSPAGVPGPLVTSFRRPHAVFQLGKPEVAYDPFRLIALPVPTGTVLRRAIAAAGGRRLFFAVQARNGLNPLHDRLIKQTLRQMRASLPAGHRAVTATVYPGLVELAVVTYANGASSPG